MAPGAQLGAASFPWPKTRRSKTIPTNPSAMNSPAGVSTHWLQGGFRFGRKSNYYRGAV